MQLDAAPEQHESGGEEHARERDRRLKRVHDRMLGLGLLLAWLYAHLLMHVRRLSEDLTGVAASNPTCLWAPLASFFFTIAWCLVAKRIGRPSQSAGRRAPIPAFLVLLVPMIFLCFLPQIVSGLTESEGARVLALAVWRAFALGMSVGLCALGAHSYLRERRSFRSWQASARDAA